MIKTPLCSKTVSTKYMPIILQTFIGNDEIPYESNILDRNKTIDNQSILISVAKRGTLKDKLSQVDYV